MDRAVKLAGEFGIRRAVPLPVSAPFHCALMQPAADRMAEALEAVTLAAPSVPLISNVTAAPVTDAKKSRACSSARSRGLYAGANPSPIWLTMARPRCSRLARGAC